MADKLSMRVARASVPGAVHHIISRFVEHTWFLNHDVERRHYLELFGEALAETDWRCLAYALMSNHLHFAMVAGEMPMASWTKPTNSPFARWLNKRLDRIGPMFADRADEWVIAPHNEGDVIAYIHNNPVRARVVERAGSSTWTSHRAYAGLVAPPPWLHVDEGLARSGFRDKADFDAWVRESVGERWEYPTLSEMRRDARRLGSIEVATPALYEVPLVGKPDAWVRPSPRAVVMHVADVLGVDVRVMCSRSAQTSAVLARRIAVHVGRRAGLAGSQMANVLGVSPQAASQLARRRLLESEQQILVSVEARMWRRRRA